MSACASPCHRTSTCLCNASVGKACRPGTCQKYDRTQGICQSGSQCGTGQKYQWQPMTTQDPGQIQAPSCHNCQSAVTAPSRTPLHFLCYMGPSPAFNIPLKQNHVLPALGKNTEDRTTSKPAKTWGNGAAKDRRQCRPGSKVSPLQQWEEDNQEYENKELSQTWHIHVTLCRGSFQLNGGILCNAFGAKPRNKQVQA
eukprot:14362025-Ditylum_brightwellii.AAC.1